MMKKMTMNKKIVGRNGLNSNAYERLMTQNRNRPSYTRNDTSSVVTEEDEIIS